MAVINVTKTYEFNDCSGCPDLTTGRSFGNDGRDGSTVYICNKGCFGSKNSVYGSYDSGPYHTPKTPPISCPHIKSNEVNRLAIRLNVSYDTLLRILKDEKLTVVKEEKLLW